MADFICWAVSANLSSAHPLGPHEGNLSRPLTLVDAEPMHGLQGVVAVFLR